MLEIVWTRRAGDHLQRVFSELDAIAPALAEAWLEDVGRRALLLSHFPEMGTLWKPPFRRLVLRRELGLYYTIEGRRLIFAGIYSLRMDPEAIAKRLEQTDWP